MESNGYSASRISASFDPAKCPALFEAGIGLKRKHQGLKVHRPIAVRSLRGRDEVSGCGRGERGERTVADGNSRCRVSQCNSSIPNLCMCNSEDIRRGHGEGSQGQRPSCPERLIVVGKYGPKWSEKRSFVWHASASKEAVDLREPAPSLSPYCLEYAGNTPLVLLPPASGFLGRNDEKPRQPEKKRLQADTAGNVPAFEATARCRQHSPYLSVSLS